MRYMFNEIILFLIFFKLKNYLIFLKNTGFIAKFVG
jgi:hypothetical protein